MAGGLTALTYLSQWKFYSGSNYFFSHVLALWLLLMTGCASTSDINTDLQESIDWYTGAAGYVNDELAKALLERAATSQDPLALMWMARVYSTGRMGFAQDLTLARRIAAGVIGAVEQLASEGNAEANFLIGTAFAEGLGRPLDPAEAARWYERAARMGNMLAHHNMGNIYAAGTGVPQDDLLAVSWWQQAAAQGDAIPQFRLAVMFEEGRGTNFDMDAAIRWYEDSARRGYSQAKAALARLEKSN